MESKPIKFSLSKAAFYAGTPRLIKALQGGWLTFSGLVSLRLLTNETPITIFGVELSAMEQLYLYGGISAIIYTLSNFFHETPPIIADDKPAVNDGLPVNKAPDQHFND